VRTTTVLEHMLIEGWIGQYAVSASGTAAYVPGTWLFGTELVWDDGQGHVEPLGFPLLGYGDFELSPDGTMLAITVGGGRDAQAWIYDLDRGARRLLTTDTAGSSAIWSPDGQRLAYTAVQDGKPALVVRTLGSNETTVLVAEGASWFSPYAWHPEVGILYTFGPDIHVIDPDNPADTRPLVVTAATEWGPDISPDGRWMAYTSDESGRYEVYARALAGERSWTVSLDGGEEPIFSADGKTLYYRYGNRFYATPILEASADGTRFRAGKPRVVVEGAYSNVPGLSYDVGPDGRLLLLRSDGGTERPGYLNVILDWDVELARRLADSR
jgi:serine/threonine-protein kinase